MDSPSIKIVSLNIERSKHLDLVRGFLEQEQPDVFSVQELCRADIPHFESMFGGEYVFVPMAIFDEIDKNEMSCELGLGIFSRFKIAGYRTHFYAGSQNTIPEYQHPDQGTINRCLLVCDVSKDDVLFRIGTTHFTWTPDGMASDTQRRDTTNLFEVLDKESEIVFTGDFNAPRDGEIFKALAERYKDNVPPEYTTSIDGTYHRAGNLERMVDGIFSTPGYEVSNVRMECGVSDHCALVGTVSRKE